MLMANGQVYRTGVRRRTIQRQLTFGPVTIKVVTLVIFAVAAFIALAQSTASATKNYELAELDRQKSEKEEEVERLKIETARLSALSSVVGQGESPAPSPSPSSQLEQPKQINYLPSGLLSAQQPLN